MTGSTGSEVYRLTARCPRCGAPIRLRNTLVVPSILKAASESVQLDPETVVQTYQCASRLPDGALCNTLVEIKAKHWRKVG